MIDRKKALFLLVGVTCFALVIATSAQVRSQQSSLDQQDQKFMEKAAVGGKMEVELGKMAVEKAESDAVKEFGRRMVDDHTKVNENLKQLAEQKGVELPTALDEKHQGEVEKLSGLSGKELDCQYMTMMVRDHDKDISEFKKEAETAHDADLKAFAADTLKTLEEHHRIAVSTEKEACGTTQ